VNCVRFDACFAACDEASVGGDIVIFFCGRGWWGDGGSVPVHKSTLYD
jgi:hypothetical protein